DPALEFQARGWPLRLNEVAPLPDFSVPQPVQPSDLAAAASIRASISSSLGVSALSARTGPSVCSRRAMASERQKWISRRATEVSPCLRISEAYIAAVRGDIRT